MTLAVLRGAPPQWPLWPWPTGSGCALQQLLLGPGGCGPRASLFQGMFDLPRPGVKQATSPELLSGFSPPSQREAASCSRHPRLPCSPGRTVKPPGVRGSSQRGAFRQGPRGSLSLSLPESQERLTQSPERAGFARSAPLYAPSFH